MTLTKKIANHDTSTYFLYPLFSLAKTELQLQKGGSLRYITI